MAVVAGALCVVPLVLCEVALGEKALPPGGVYDYVALKGSKKLKKLRARLKTDETVGGMDLKGLTDAEVDAFLRDERLKTTYWEKLLDVVEPGFPSRHHSTHAQYFERLVKSEWIDKGAAFVKAHRETLDAVEARYGISKYDIVGILVAETKLGTITGGYLTANAFMTAHLFTEDAMKHGEASFRASAKGKKGVEKRIKKSRKRARRRARRAADDLVILAKVCKRRGVDIFSVKGSWAGAIGYPQFMPRSLRHAVDADGDERFDLMTWPDTLHSVANYLRMEGYRKSRRKGIWNYNHDKAYVDGVIALAEKIRAKVEAKD